MDEALFLLILTIQVLFYLPEHTHTRQLFCSDCWLPYMNICAAPRVQRRPEFTITADSMPNPSSLSSGLSLAATIRVAELHPGVPGQAVISRLLSWE